jgi:hypothetical protein
MDDPDYPMPYWVLGLHFVAPIKLHDGAMMYRTFVRRVEAQ